MEDLDQRRTESRSVWPSPADGATLGINPDGFIWLPVRDAAEYELTVRRRGDDALVLRERTADHYHVPDQPFPPGEYAWTLRAFDADGASLGRRAPWEFTVPEEATVAVPPSARAVLDDLHEEHPRLVFPGSTLEEVREWAHADGSAQIQGLREAVEEAYEMGMPPEPEFHRQGEEWKQYYNEYFSELRSYVDGNLRACALAYLLDGDEEAGAFAREMLLHVCGWNPEGPNSVRWTWGDEPGLSFARILPQAYDWTHDRYSDREREYVESTLVRYCRQTYDRLREGEFTMNPTASHPARLPGYLGEMAILLRDRLEAGEAAEMLQYVIDVLSTFYPHWGGDDGGWAEGVPYGIWYNRWYVPFFATFERQAGYSFWDQPFFHRYRDFLVHCAPPETEHHPFGDQQEQGGEHGDAIRNLLELHADVFDDPVARWRADQFDADDGGFRFYRFVYPPGNSGGRSADEAAGIDLPDSRAFRDVGVAALHSDVAEPTEDVYLAFRSSPYGNVSHSRNDQNAFCLSAGGHALAIGSGYRPHHGCPHHVEWTRETKAHNSVLVDGAGQDRGMDATGRLARFEDGDGYSYLRGEAAEAYGDRLERFDRRILFVDPGLFLIYDDLSAPDPATFDWLVHTLEEPTMDAEAARIDVERGSARMRVQLATAGELSLDATDEFDTPPNEGIVPEFQEEWADQHHVTARTDRRESAAILAVVTAGQGPLPDVSCERRDDEVRIEHPRFNGEVALGGDAPLIAGEVTDGTGGTTSLRFP